MKAMVQTGFWAVVILAVQQAIVVQSAETLQCEILEDVFPSCPCRAAPQEVGSIVDCSALSLTAVPTIQAAYDREIYKFILKNNNIVTLTNSSFQGLKIRHLDLSDNPIASVERGTFVSMKDSLRTLEIDGNSASRPPSDALQVLTLLSTLVMRKFSAPILDKDIMSFLPFSYLKTLTLDSWDTTFIEHDVLLNVDSLSTLNLWRLKLVNLPLDLLNDHPLLNLETLHISYNEIQHVTHSAFSKLVKLKNLDLSHNKIAELEDSCFKDVEDTMVNLNLNGNLLRDQISGLVGLTNLEHLDLSENIFNQIPSMPSLGTTKPLTLLLNKNEVDVVQSNAFNGYAQYLTKLDLTANFIRSMNINSFAGVTQLRSLHLNDQRGGDDAPVVLPLTLTNSANTIQEMDLSGQKVDPTSMWNVIKELRAIQKLNLNSIELTSIPDNIFTNVDSLTDLDLSFNSLSQINQNSIMGLRNLQSLNVEANNLRTMPSCLFHGFESAKIVVHLANNNIRCDCNLKKFIEDVRSGRIELDAESVCTEDNQPIATKDPNNLGCSPDHQEDTCSEYPTMDPVTEYPTMDPVTDTPKSLILSVTAGEVTTNSLTATWTITSHTYIDSFMLKVTETSTDVRLYEKDVSKENKLNYTENVSGLPEGTTVEVCVTAFVISPLINPVTKCTTKKTASTNPGPSTEANTGDSSSSTGIIVGCVVAGVALIGVLIAIIILLVLRKRPKEIKDNTNPTQPRHFAKAELPSMTEESRTFKKPQKRVSNPEPKGMQVVAISDGQTSPGARVGRANMMFQPEDGYEPMKNFKKMNNGSNGSVYENDRGSLPPTPSTPGRDSIPPAYPGGYYNQGFRDDKYDKIEVEL